MFPMQGIRLYLQPQCSHPKPKAVVAVLIKEATEADAAIERRRQAAARVRIEAELLEQARRGDENIRELIAIHEGREV